jgi:hypothetical protein
MEDAEVVGIGCEGMDYVELGLPLRGKHRPGIDTLSPRPERPAAAAKDRAESGLGNGRDFADEIELVILQPQPHTGIELGQHLERMGSEKPAFVSSRDIQQ